MNNYFVLIGGWALGQLALIVLRAWDIQRKKDNLNLESAVKMVLNKESASWVFGIVMLLIALFLMPEAYKQAIDADNNMKPLSKWQLELINRTRYYSIPFGVFCQLIGLFIFGKGKKFFYDEADKQGIDLPKS